MFARTILVVVLACAGPALGSYEGTITAPSLALSLNDGPKTFDILITGPVSIDGINLNLQIGDGAWPAYIDGPRFLDVDLDGTGLLFHGNSIGQTKIIITPQMLWIGTVTPAAGQFINIPAGQPRVLARVVIEPGEWNSFGYWPLSLTSRNGPTDYADAFGAKFPVLIDGSVWVPEPASLLLLMARSGLALRRTRLSSRR